ncbi:response regulator transcription factor [Rhodopirellula baltica]|uniref:Transcriptional regulator, LuxR family protein n=1 Tax=Rhodopirellula baltica SWK14 TaxID=993516 RepID=L7CAI9_RHOBT|nr:helix-turn-helix transcriptional regulator [Rhodopirellula baltica]ELP31018.1 transcriptional regulator, LuxR family protein [Rhodopirellula baltica SWK14]
MEFSAVVFNKLVQLWDELEAFPVDKATEANVHLMKTLSTWLDSDYAYWCGLLRVVDGDAADEDPLGGWRMRVSEPYKLPQIYEDHREEILENQHLAETVGAASIAIMKEAGSFRIRLLRELVDLSEYEKSSHFQKLQMPYGLTDRVYIVTPVNDDTESCFCFEIASDEGKRFDSEATNLVGTALRSVRWFQRRLFLSHGLVVGDEIFSEMERRIVLLLLTDKSEKEIASEIGRATSTTHNYVTGIYRKFGVNNRAGLMAIWLG